MKRSFNVNGICYPEENYMVNLDGRLKEIKKLVDEKKYFLINRARQYGKTTILWALHRHLQKDYIVVFLSFQSFSYAKFKNEHAFATAFAKSFLSEIRNNHIRGLDAQIMEELENVVNHNPHFELMELFEYLSRLCATAKKPIVLLIDEVDSASNNQVFLDFLGQLRAAYLDRKRTSAFHSVILAGVYDIKNLKQKIRADEEHRYNSPWNIAADFNIDMSFSVDDIVGMLKEYEKDNQTGMDIKGVAELLYDYTSGYPYLVSRMCKLIAERNVTEEGAQAKSGAWSKEGIIEVVKQLMNESNTLFDDMRKKIEDYPQLKEILYVILFRGQSIPYNPDNFIIDIGKMFGFLKEAEGQVAVANRIFETRIYNMFMAEGVVQDKSYNAAAEIKNQFVLKGYLNMDLVMEKFMAHFTEVYADSTDTFIEENGRRLFLLYLKPIINGVGNYYVEARTRDQRRTDVIVDYRGRQYVIEMKLWHGDEYNHRGELQLAGYLDAYHLDKGYMVSFNFNKNKQAGIKEIVCGDKRILEVVV